MRICFSMWIYVYLKDKDTDISYLSFKKMVLSIMEKYLIVIECVQVSDILWLQILLTFEYLYNDYVLN